MRKPVTFRLDAQILERARRHAIADNRTLTNFVETALLRVLEHSDALEFDGHLVMIDGKRENEREKDK